jgi:hypothetical protein
MGSRRVSAEQNRLGITTEKPRLRVHRNEMLRDTFARRQMHPTRVVTFERA